MILTEVILRLRAECPFFSRRIGGTAKFSLVSNMEEEKIGVPCAFVMPMGDSGDDRANDNATVTEVTERFAIVVCVSNHTDRSRGDGMSALESLKVAKQELYNALVAWRPIQLGKEKLKLNLENDGNLDAEVNEILFADVVPDSEGGTFSYRNSEHLHMTPARMWHQFEFDVTYRMDKTNQEIDYGEITKIYLGMADDIGLEHIDDYDLIYDADNGGWVGKPVEVPNE